VLVIAFMYVYTQYLPEGMHWFPAIKNTFKTGWVLNLCSQKVYLAFFCPCH